MRRDGTVRVPLLLPITLLLVSGTAGAGEYDFVGVKKCKSCHAKEEMGDQYTLWKESVHAGAFKTLGTEKAKEWAAERGLGDPQTEDDCLKCHTTAHGVPDESLGRSFARSDGVQCEGCHGAGKDYRKKKIMADPETAISKGLVPQSEKVCIVCHNDESPAWDPARYTLADGTTAGFDYDQAVEEIAHPVPEEYDPFGGDPE
jgi:hypothetical protein